MKRNFLRNEKKSAIAIAIAIAVAVATTIAIGIAIALVKTVIRICESQYAL